MAETIEPGSPIAATWLDRALSALIALVLFAMMTLTAIDVIGRYVLSRPVPGAYEISQFLLALMIFAALPIVTREQSHITVSLFEGALSGIAKRVQRILVHIVSGVAIGVIGWQMFSLGGRLTRGRAATGFLEWPIAPIAYVMCALSAVALIVLLGLLWRECRGGEAHATRAAPDV